MGYVIGEFDAHTDSDCLRFRSLTTVRAYCLEKTLIGVGLEVAINLEISCLSRQPLSGTWTRFDYSATQIGTQRERLTEGVLRAAESAIWVWYAPSFA